MAHTHFAFAVLTGRMGRHGEALDHARRVHDLYRAVTHRRGEALALNVVGRHEAHLGDAVTCYENSLTLYQNLGDRYHEASILHHLGDVRYDTGQTWLTAQSFERALAILEDLDHPDRHGQSA